ncbi:TIGR01212 family radical SAM protein [Sulfurospirillum arcachonense]|uniref:TIGR01212 family radical SAM protein n=1 Tax=Sulfurospirillum arcachonense TaxID=57666 RepID=UPI00046A10F8|nr:TIGR01212 family radical SAM protein [Sulfurospirillum arcachonense]
MQEVLTAGRYFRKHFNCNVYKTPISILGFTCPNIDGSKARGGCVFCENESFSPNLGIQKPKGFLLNHTSVENPFIASQLVQLESQFNQTKKILAKKFKAKKFLVYFQSFTNTYAPFKTLKALYDKALSFEDTIGISIGTRADSIEKEILEYLSEKAKTKEIWIEYGIQSVYNETLEKINRAETIEDIEKQIKLTRKYGIKVCAHLIFGLPGETQEMMLESVKKAIELGVESIKIHPLYVVKKTALANDFKKKQFTPISEEEYIDTLVKTIKLIPKEMMVQRITAGISDDSLLSPFWCNNKHRQMYNIKEALKKEGYEY